jgi:uncharacterized protein YkwD
MNKLLLALFAITIITASVVSAPYSTEARNESDIRSTSTLRYRSIVELRTSEGDSYRKRDNSNVQLLQLRADKVTVTKPVKVENTKSTQPKTTPVEKETKPVVISEETVNNDSDDTPSDEFMAVLAGEIHRLTNTERERAGVSKLGYDNALAAIARGHSEDMALNNYFSHTAQDGCTLSCRFKEAGYTAKAWGENIAWRSSSKQPEAKELAAIFVEMWMNSDGHRKNMLSSNFTREGVGLTRIGDKVYATVNFANPK